MPIGAATDLDRDREQDEGRPVVEEALTVDQRGQRGRHAHALERGDHRRRVGRRHHRTDDEREIEPKAGRDREDDRDDRGRDEHARDGEQGRARRPSAGVRRCADGRRPRTRDRAAGRAGRGRARRRSAGIRPRRDDPDEQPGDDEADRVGQAEWTGHDRDEGREAQQTDQQFDRSRDRLVCHRPVTVMCRWSPNGLALSDVDALEDAQARRPCSRATPRRGSRTAAGCP